MLCLLPCMLLCGWLGLIDREVIPCICDHTETTPPVPERAMIGALPLYANLGKQCFAVLPHFEMGA